MIFLRRAAYCGLNLKALSAPLWPDKRYVLTQKEQIFHHNPNTHSQAGSAESNRKTVIYVQERERKCNFFCAVKDLLLTVTTRSCFSQIVME